MWKSAWLAILCAGMLSVAAQAPQADLEAAWRNPPPQARPHVYWLWMNGHVDVEAAKAELAAMKEAGIGGVLLFDMGARGDAAQQPPVGPAFLSDAWLEKFRVLTGEAKRLGLQVDFTVISSWDLGGAWTRPEHASMALYPAELPVSGGARIEKPLPYPVVPAGVPKGADGKAAHWRHVAAVAVPASQRMPGHDFVFQLEGETRNRDLRSVVLDPGDLGPGPPPVPMSPVRRFEVSLSSDGQNFQALVQAELPRNGAARSFALPPGSKGTYVRLRLLDAWDAAVPNWTLGEFQALDDRGRNVIDMRAPNRALAASEMLVAPVPFSTGATWNIDNIRDGDRLGPRGVFATGGPPPFNLPKEGAISLDRFVDEAGILRWDAPPGDWRILRYVAMNTGEKLKVASPNSDGWATDHLNPEATRAHMTYVLDRLRTVFPDLGKSGLANLYLPSYEVVGHIWSPGFLRDFQRLRGYDLTPYLPLVFGSTAGGEDITARVNFDYRKTLSDVLIEAYYKAALEEASKAGLGIKSEAGGPGPPVHNVPVDSLLANANVSEVQGEFWPFRPDADALWVIKETASAAHVYGKRRVHMESFTSTHHWYEAPQDLKESADRAFCEGMNHVVWHTWSHVPGGSPKPGWVYLAGSHINRNVTWWPFAKPFFDYLSRASALLQRGNFAGDVLYYYGDGGYKFVGPRRSPPGLGPGYDYDAINSDAILRRLSVRDGRWTLPDGTSFEVLVLPEEDAADPDVLSKLESLVQAGGTLIGAPPKRAYGLGGFPASDRRVADTAARLWHGLDGKSQTAKRVAKGFVHWGVSEREVLDGRKVRPDFSGGSDLDFTHRRDGGTDIYFVRNTKREAVSREVEFRVTGLKPELWDPVSGQIADAPEWRNESGATKLKISLAPLASTFVVFRHKASPAPSKRYDSKSAEMSLTGPWALQFPGEADAVNMMELRSWTELPEERRKHFAGTATYRVSFDAPAPQAGVKYSLDLGRLSSVAHVRWNGRDLGIVWTHPFSVDVTRALRQGLNEVEIAVTNTWHNRLVGDAKLPPAQRVTGTNVTASAGKAWKDWEPLPSGLFGPVKLVSIRER